MRVQKYGYTWTSKQTGYYQSTTAIDGRRQWLHRYTYEREVGAIPEGCHVHHKNGDRDNNEIENLACLEGAAHRREHLSDATARGRTPESLARLAEMRWLAASARRGLYVGPRKQRKGLVRKVVCNTCRTEFELKKTDSDRTVYCSEKCSQHTRLVYTDAFYAAERPCLHCGESFAPGIRAAGSKQFCSSSCRDKYRYNYKHCTRTCVSCGESYCITKGSATTYCAACLSAGRNKVLHECTACGREVLSRVKNGRVFCGQQCSNKYRGLEGNPESIARYRQAVADGVITPERRKTADV